MVVGAIVCTIWIGPQPFSSKVFKKIKRDGEEMNKSDAIYHINAAPCHVFGYACTFLVKAYGYVKKNFAAKKWPLEEFYAICRGEVNVWEPSYGQKMHRSVLLHDIIMFVCIIQCFSVWLIFI